MATSTFKEKLVNRDGRGRFAKKNSGMNDLLRGAAGVETHEVKPINEGWSTHQMDQWAEEHLGIGKELRGKDFKGYIPGERSSSPRSKTSPISSTEASVISDYQGNGYIDINDLLRKGRNNYGPSDTYVPSAIKTLDGVMDKHPIPEDVVVRRGMSASGFGIGKKQGQRQVPVDLDLKELEGRTFRDNGFLSTSMAEELPAGLAMKPIELILKVPKGTKGIYLAHTPNGFPQEHELTLERGVEFRVDEAELGLNQLGRAVWLVGATVTGVKRKAH